ncbi:transposase [Streptomyces sp. NPDC093228]|uniref:transposase n=1 Tax=Streptomyces sp. NPDC093228 TaxID=3155070 RepID=UPI00342C5D1B
MTAPDSLPLDALAEDTLAVASLDLLRAMVKTFADAIMSAEADALGNAEYGQVSDERVNQRSGYRPRERDTRESRTMELAVPELRTGSFFPHWLFERRRGAEQALIRVAAIAYLLAVFTRRVEMLEDAGRCQSFQRHRRAEEGSESSRRPPDRHETHREDGAALVRGLVDEEIPGIRSARSALTSRDAVRTSDTPQ